MKLKKYSDDLVKTAVRLYMDDPYITQAKLAKKMAVPLSTLGGWLRCRHRGLTVFQRVKRNRDNLIRVRYNAAQARINKARENQVRIADNYGIGLGYVRKIAKSN